MAGVAVNRATDLKTREGLVAEYEARIHELEADLRYVKNRADDPLKKELDRVERDRLVSENEQLRMDVARLTRRPDAGYDKRSHAGMAPKVNEVKRSCASKLINSLLRRRSSLRAMSALQTLRANAMAKAHRQQLLFKAKNSTNSQNEDTESKLELQDEVFNLGKGQTDLVKVVGKVVRAVNQDTNIKLPLAHLVSKQSIGFLMSGLKGNYRVQELDLSECALDDEDLERIASRLIEDRGIKTLLLGQNSFSSAAPLVPLLRSKSSQYRRLDLSNCGADAEAIQSGLPDALGSMRALEDLQLRESLVDSRPSDAKLLLESVLTGCSNLRAIDLSNNPLSSDNLNHFLTVIAKRGAHTIEALALSEVNITQDSHSALVTAIGALGLLRKLDLSGNEKLGAQTVQQILRALI